MERMSILQRKEELAELPRFNLNKDTSEFFLNPFSIVTTAAICHTIETLRIIVMG